MTPATMEWIGTALFALAVLHTFSTKFFDHLSHTRPAHAGVFHLLGEVEIVFGFWAMVLFAFFVGLQGKPQALAYVDGLNFTEPMFVFAIMVIAASRAILQTSRFLVETVSRLLPFNPQVAFFVTTMSLVPLLGSFITEPAAMTLAALILRDRFYGRNVPERFKYAILGVLFVNISIGGVLTPYAAPPVLMVAATWNWDIGFMISTFGWRAIIAVLFNAAFLTFWFRKELSAQALPERAGPTITLPIPLLLLHLILLVGVVLFAHDPPVFMGFLLLYLGVAEAYPQHQDKLLLREALLVAFFLAGLVVLGGLQRWWLQPLLTGMTDTQVYFGATALTAITDNAALTYLGSLVQGLTDEFKYALVAGAVTGGGLTVIANAPNPAGYSILRSRFHEGSISPLGLLGAATPPTLVAIVCFWFL
ncbi:MAG: putative Na+/H+ antiporter [Ahniella sp.]|nr:putative Na+/H+ antiporter [Ahniella sp.]